MPSGPPVMTSTERDDADAAMERYADGDDAAFGIVYDRIAPRLLAFLRRRLRNDARAEDLLQQTLLNLVAGRASFLPGARVMPWACVIARRLLIDDGGSGRRPA